MRGIPLWKPDAIMTNHNVFNSLRLLNILQIKVDINKMKVLSFGIKIVSSLKIRGQKKEGEENILQKLIKCNIARLR